MSTAALLWALNATSLLHALGPWALVGIGVVVFIESGVLFPFLPGDSLLLTAAILASEIHVAPWQVAAVAAVAAIGGDQTGYWLGARFGRRLFRPGARVLTNSRLDEASVFFARYGGLSLVLGRFVPVVRTFVPLAAGMARMRYRRFFAWNAIGGVLWCAVLVVAGRLLGRIPLVRDHIDVIMILLVAVSVLPVVLGVLVRRRRRSQARHGVHRLPAADRDREASGRVLPGEVVAPRSGRMRGSVRVPAPTVGFWLSKGVSTALGEAVSDFSIHILPPVVAVLLGFVFFAAALTWQLTRRRYRPVPYWLAVAAVGVFGTMAADVLHVALGMPYIVTTVLYAVILAAVFLVWRAVERDLDVHDVRTARRELLYWAAVVATFAMGTALGDLSATGIGLGYPASAALFALLILLPWAGHRFGRWNGVFAFWFAYVLTRPLGASIADGLGKPVSAGGLGWGDGTVAAIFTAVLGGLVTLEVVRFRRAARRQGSASREASSTPPAPPADRALGRV